MALGRPWVAALLAGATLLCACSSSGVGANSAVPTATAPGMAESGVAESTATTQSSAVTSTSASSTAGSAAQNYLDAVDRLCDALLPRVIAVTNGGSLDVPVKQYLAQQPAHAKLLAAFDRQLATVTVPPTAKNKAAVLATYVRFANRLDAKRLAAAHRGAAAYAAEVRSEASIESSPAIVALGKAGFNQSCEAR